MKHKYYYNNQLVRSSENEYKYALLFKGENGTYKTCKCSSSYDACLKELNYKTRAETISKQTGLSFDEIWKSRKYNLCSSQFCERENYIIVELEQR